MLVDDETYSYEIVGDFIENNAEIILNTAVPSTAYETYGEAQQRGHISIFDKYFALCYWDK